MASTSLGKATRMAGYTGEQNKYTWMIATRPTEAHCELLNKQQITLYSGILSNIYLTPSWFKSKTLSASIPVHSVRFNSMSKSSYFRQNSP